MNSVILDSTGSELIPSNPIPSVRMGRPDHPYFCALQFTSLSWCISNVGLSLCYSLSLSLINLFRFVQI